MCNTVTTSRPSHSSGIWCSSMIAGFSEFSADAPQTTGEDTLSTVPERERTKVFHSNAHYATLSAVGNPPAMRPMSTEPALNSRPEVLALAIRTSRVGMPSRSLASLRLSISLPRAVPQLWQVRGAVMRSGRKWTIALYSLRNLNGKWRIPTLRHSTLFRHFRMNGFVTKAPGPSDKVWM